MFKADPNHPLHSKLRPRLDDISEGRVTLTKLAREFGITVPAVSSFLQRHYPDNVPGQGGIYPTSPEMLAALKEAVAARNVAAVAKKHGVDYRGLVRRVKNRRDKAPVAEKTVVCETAEQWTALLGFPVRVG